ncbi:Heat shock protein HSP70 [Ceratobasidium theobromae]|uniref:Heat shock protein HSP70 n=1 Tax=Ceratobasidium theobromae TaxID=1582974 RepID=A0A5N5QG07_9AGAM|nr:Heat shock protein HSP70 [Ceratobasidium theobromae]
MSSRGSVDPIPKPLRGPWEGENKIVLGIDIGTTQSGVAFTYLQTGGWQLGGKTPGVSQAYKYELGANQIVHRVTRWPGQEAREEQGKIPTVVWYDTDGKAVSFGAEAMSDLVEEEAEDKGWFLAKYFKLHLHPDDMKAKHKLKLDELPPGVRLRQIYSDFLGYLLKHTQTFFEDRILDGKQTWERYKPTMEVIIAHPNGWGIREQSFLRDAAVDAGFAKSDDASNKIRFVTEAEASVHYCIYHTNLGSRLQPGTNFGVSDAGGSTVDTTLYSVISSHPVLKLKELRASACVQAGAIFVDFEAERHLRKTLGGGGLSQADIDEYTKTGIKDFEGFAKRAFQNETTDQSIKIGPSRFTNAAIGTRRGRMTLPGPKVKEFFDVCVNEIISSVDQQLSGLTVPYILLVGGFGDSLYLRDEFKKRYEPRGSQITRTNDSTSKAVADGAVIWNIINSVFSRAPRYSFGVVCAKTILPWMIREHRGREVYMGADGLPVIPGAWSQIVKKGVALDSDASCRETYTAQTRSKSEALKSLSMDLYAYSGDDQPEWAWDQTENLLPSFRKVCTITGDLRNVEDALERNIGLLGAEFWSLDVNVCIRFGGTELEANLEWKENGIVRTGPAKIVPGDTIEF